MDNYQLWGGIFICLLLSAFFSGIEIAFISSDRLHIELKASKGSLSYRILNSFIKKQAMFIGTTLIGNTVTLVVYGMLMAKVMETLLSPYMNDVLMMLVQTILSTLLVLATAEFIPKSLFLINSNLMLVSFAVPMQVISWILWIPAFITVQLSKLIIVYVFKGNYSEEKPVYGLTDLNNFLHELVNNSNKNVNNADVNTKIFNNALEFKTVKVRDCMIPRTEMIAVDINSTVNELKRAFIDSGHSKVLIYRQSIDEVIGYCHSSDLFHKPEKIQEIITDIIIVPEAKLANDLMIEFIEKRKSVSLVVDEFGGTSGLVTIEDIIEQIFGEIQDEHDDEDLTEHIIDENTFVFSGRQEIDYLNEQYEINLPEGEYDTLGGLILNYHAEIPKINDLIIVNQFHFEIKSMDGIKIDRVRLIIHKKDDNR